MKKPINILDTCAYVEPYTFETVGEANLFQSYVEHIEFVEELEKNKLSNSKLKISDNPHPNTNGSVWGVILIEGTNIRICTYSGNKEREFCQKLVNLHNAIL
jgi:hypothetical protein